MINEPIVNLVLIIISYNESTRYAPLLAYSIFKQESIFPSVPPFNVRTKYILLKYGLISGDSSYPHS